MIRFALCTLATEATDGLVNVLSRYGCLVAVVSFPTRPAYRQTHTYRPRLYTASNAL